ncbi:cache domain-containing protein [Sphingomonas sp. HF-S4]|uniref:Cache domain-containing protein n=1 Tax=Sphingomonas agrestis TaxID=3080540 RepID=A0ABU3Y6C9_9SPHN|nr:cache domain-containing protein [Sphingomonas sp. HF-S4]MDV3456973.1 cache domain-containing protein [Sphingomonas sp. HF-S4]
MLAKFNALSLATKTTVLTIAALLTLALTIFVIADRSITADAGRQAAERQETNMRVAWNVLHGHGGEFRAEGDALYVGDKKLNDWTQPVDLVKELVGGTATIFRGDTRITTNVTKPDGSRAVGTPLAAGEARDTVLGQGKPFRGSADILGRPFYTAYDPIKDKAGNVIGVLYVGIPKDEALAAVSALRWSMAIGVLLATLLITAVIFAVNRASFRPLGSMNAAMQDLAKGSTTTEIPGRDRSDEIGRMAQALVAFRDAAVERVRIEASSEAANAERQTAMTVLNETLRRVSQGDLTVSLDARFPASYAELRTNFNEAMGALSTLVGTVLESTDTIRSGATEIATASEDLARRTESNAASLEETAAAVAQMNGRVGETAAAASSTVERADGAIATVSDGRAVADDAVQAMSRVAAGAKGIDSVIEGLDKIAFQTRVLAMNAAVEAGRAGEAGRGFAVVADLVSALAMRSEEEAARARDQLTATQTDIVSAVDAIEKVDTALSEIVGTVGEVHGLVARIATDNSAQSSAIGEISTAIGAMDRSTQQNAAMVEETSAAARNLSDQVDRLATQARTFRVQEDRRTKPRGAFEVAGPATAQ